MTPTEKEPAREPEIATGTLAEIYAQQGLYDRALEIYRRMERRRPDDPEIGRRIAAIERARDERDADEGPGPEPREALGPEAGEAPPEEPVEPDAEASMEEPVAPAEEPVDERSPEPAAGSEPDPSPLDEDEAFREWLQSR